jgi:hypothetical protein
MNRYSASNAQDVKDFNGYRQLVRPDIASGSPAVVDSDDMFFIADRSTALTYSSKENRYSMGLSLFLQQLAVPVEGRTSFRTFLLHPAAENVAATNPDVQSGLKTVNRVVFPKDQIKLKIFYTKPTTAR